MRFSKPGQAKPKRPEPGQPETAAINRFHADGVKAAEEEDSPGLNTAPGNPLYRALALYLPWSVLLSLLPPALALIRRLLPDLKLPGALGAAVYIPALLISAAVTLYLEFLDPRTSHSGAHLRGGILACAAAYLFSSLLALRAPPALSTVTLLFLPSLGSVTAVLAALYIWIFVIYLRELFRARELFESQIRLHRGEDLQRVMLEDSAIMSAAETRGLSAGRHYGFQTGLALLLVLLCDFLGAPLSILQRIISVLAPAAAALVFFLFSLFRQEQFFAGEGIAVPPPERARRIGAGFIFCAAATLLAALCASNNNILPISIIGAFFAWLARLLSRPGRAAPVPIEAAPPNFPMEDPQAMLRFLAPEAAEPWPFWDYLPYIALAAAIAVFLWFMIKPLFSLDRRAGKRPLILRLARLFSGGFTSLRRALKNFFASLRGRSGIRIRIPGEKVRDMTEALLSAWSRARKRELRQSLSLFARLILWGGREHQTAWKPSMGPGEYCSLLSSAIKRKALSTGHEGGSLPPRPSPPGIAAAVLASPPPRGKRQGQGDTVEGGKTASPTAPPRRPRDPPAPSGEKTAAAVIHCGAIFEEVLYGPRLPDGKTRREFRRLVEEITGQRRRPQN